MTGPTASLSGGGQKPGRQPRTPAEWAAEWVRKFTVYRQRRFGAAATAEPDQVAAFLRFIAVRWSAPEWQQAQAREALEAWLRSETEPAPLSAGQPAQGETDASGTPAAEGSSPPEPEPEKTAKGDGTPEGERAKLTLPQALLKLQGALRLKHYSVKTEEAYQHWLRRYWAFLQMHKVEPGFAGLETAGKVKAFLEHLAVDRHVTASTQNQALKAG